MDLSATYVFRKPNDYITESRKQRPVPVVMWADYAGPESAWPSG